MQVFGRRSAERPEPLSCRRPKTCTQADSRTAALPGLFYHLVGASKQRGRDRKLQRLGGFCVDHQIELDWGLDGKLTRLRALEDAMGIGRRAPKTIGQVNSVGQQPADSSKEDGTDRR